MSTHRLFVVDDHPMMRAGYAFLFDAEPDLEVVGEAADALTALERIPGARPDLVVADLSLGSGMNGLELVKHLLARDPHLGGVVVSLHDEALFAERALRAGARGYVMKSAPQEALLEAVRRVLRGLVYVGEEVATRLLLDHARGYAAQGQDPVEALSDRELQVFEYLGQGLTTKEVADAMMISTKTVDSYRLRIREKLSLGSHNELVRRAVQWVDSMGVSLT